MWRAAVPSIGNGDFQLFQLQQTASIRYLSHGVAGIQRVMEAQKEMQQFEAEEIPTQQAIKKHITEHARTYWLAQPDNGNPDVYPSARAVAIVRINRHLGPWEIRHFPRVGNVSTVDGDPESGLYSPLIAAMLDLGLAGYPQRGMVVGSYRKGNDRAHHFYTGLGMENASPKIVKAANPYADENFDFMSTRPLSAVREALRDRYDFTPEPVKTV